MLGQETVDANELQQQHDVADDALRDVIEKLAASRAWRHALGPTRLTGQARADLNLYARLVRRLGKGTGRYGINIFERWESQADVETFRGSGPSEEQGAAVQSASVAEYDVVSSRSLS